MRNKGILVFFGMILISLATLAQGNRYLTSLNNGKQLFQLGKFALAMEALKPSMEETPGNPYVSYASFYYAVSAYNSGFKPLARDTFLQIIEKFPDWEYNNECLYWLSVIYFEEGDLMEGFRYAYLINDDKYGENITDLKSTFMDREDSLQLLESIYLEYPYDETVAKAIVFRMNQLPFETRDFDLLGQIARRQGWAIEGIPSPDKNINKESYNIAVMFPFIYENMEASGFFLRKTAIIDLYEGIRQGVEYLNENGLPVGLFVYDTKGDSLATSGILMMPELKTMDLIIGPLLTVPSQLANRFSFENEINIINPVSSNAEVLGNNPFAFLLNPSTITLGKKAGEFAVRHLERTNTVIFHGISNTDLLMANAFKEIVEVDSFRVLANRRVHTDSAELIYEILTRKQVVLDSLGNVVMDEETQLPVEEYVIPKDSIGLIFLATFDFKIASEVFSAVAQRGDSIQIIGHGRWLSDKTANYPYMEKLGIWLLTPNYVDYSRYGYKLFADTYLSRQHTLPSDYVLMGYECILFSGYCLHQFGVYFQNELENKKIENISLYDGYDFRGSHDNQNIPILKFENLDLTIQNQDQQ